MQENQNRRQAIIDQVVKWCKGFGHKKVDSSNIFTHLVYSAFFKDILEEKKKNLKDEIKIIEDLLDLIDPEYPLD